MTPLVNLLHRYKLKHLVVLCAVSVALLFLMVLVLMPRPDSLKHSLLWQNGSGNTPRELSEAYDDAFFSNSTDEELNNSSEEEGDYGENAEEVDEDGDEEEEEGEEEEGDQEDEVMKTSHAAAGLVAGNNRAVCVGSNASLGEVEDLLCMVSAFPVGGGGVTVAVVIDVVVVVVIVAGVVVIVVHLLLPS